MDTICRELAGERAAIPVVNPIVPQQPTDLGPLMNRLARMQANLNVLKERGAEPAEVNNVRSDRDALRATVRQLQDTVARQQTNKNALHQRLREALAQPAPPPVIGPNPLANEVAALRQRLQALEIAGADQPTVAGLLQDLREVRAQVHQRNVNMVTKNRQVDELRRRITDLEGQHAVLGRERNGLVIERNDCERRLEALQAEVDAVTARLRREEQRLIEAAFVNDQNGVDELRRRIADLKDQHVVLGRQRNGLQRELEAFRAQTPAIRQEHARLLAAKDVEIAQRNTNIRHMQNQRNAVQAQLAAQGGARNATVRNLQEQRNALQGQLNGMQAKLAEQRDGRDVSVRDLQGQRNALQRQMNELVAQGEGRNVIVDRLEGDKRNLQGRLNAVQGQLRSKIEKLEAARRTTVARVFRLAGKLQMCDREFDVLEQRLANRNVEVAAVRQQGDVTQATLNQYIADWEQQKNRFLSAYERELAQRLIDHENELQAERNRRELLLTERDSLQTTLQKCRAELAECSRQLEEARQHPPDQQWSPEEVAAWRRNAEALQNVQHELIAKTDELTMMKASLKKELDNTQRNLGSQRRRATELEAMLRNERAPLQRPSDNRSIPLQHLRPIREHIAEGNMHVTPKNKGSGATSSWMQWLGGAIVGRRSETHVYGDSNTDSNNNSAPVMRPLAGRQMTPEQLERIRRGKAAQVEYEREVAEGEKRQRIAERRIKEKDRKGTARQSTRQKPQKLKGLSSGNSFVVQQPEVIIAKRTRAQKKNYSVFY